MIKTGLSPRQSRHLLALFLLALFLLALGLLSACASPRRGEPVTGTVPVESAKVARGEKAYMAFCNKCHPGGETGLAFALNNKPLPGPLIKTQVRAGVGAMPAFSKDLLHDDQLDDIVAYLETLRKHGAR